MQYVIRYTLFGYTDSLDLPLPEGRKAFVAGALVILSMTTYPKTSDDQSPFGSSPTELRLPEMEALVQPLAKHGIPWEVALLDASGGNPVVTLRLTYDNGGRPQYTSALGPFCDSNSMRHALENALNKGKTAAHTIVYLKACLRDYQQPRVSEAAISRFLLEPDAYLLLPGVVEFSAEHLRNHERQSLENDPETVTKYLQDLPHGTITT